MISRHLIQSLKISAWCCDIHLDSWAKVHKMVSEGEKKLLALVLSAHCTEVLTLQHHLTVTVLFNNHVLDTDLCAEVDCALSEIPHLWKQLIQCPQIQATNVTQSESRGTVNTLKFKHFLEGGGAWNKDTQMAADLLLLLR